MLKINIRFIATFGYISNFWIYILRTHRPIELWLLLESHDLPAPFFYSLLVFCLYNVVITSLTRTKHFIQQTHVIILYYIPFIDLLSALSCHPRLWCISRVFRAYSVFFCLTFSHYVSACVNFAFNALFGSICSFAVCFLCFCFPVHWILIKGTHNRFKTIDGIEIHFVPEHCSGRTKIRCGCQNGKKITTNWKSVRYSLTMLQKAAIISLK